MAWQVRYYVTRNGRCPYDDWFGSLDGAVQNYIASAIDRMAEEEHLGDCPAIRRSGGLRERRLHSRGGWRIYLIQEGDQLILFWGGKKEDQNRDIERAVRYLTEYRE